MFVSPVESCFGLAERELPEGFIRATRLGHGMLFAVKLETETGVNLRCAGCVVWRWVY